MINPIVWHSLGVLATLLMGIHVARRVEDVTPRLVDETAIRAQSFARATTTRQGGETGPRDLSLVVASERHQHKHI